MIKSFYFLNNLQVRASLIKFLLYKYLKIIVIMTCDLDFDEFAKIIFYNSFFKQRLAQ